MAKKAEFPEKQYIEVPISKLKTASAQVRTTETSIIDLKASIKDNGLMQNLVCTIANPDTGDHEVIIGSRRLMALRELNNDFPDMYNKVPCQVFKEKLTDAQLKIISLEENMHREDNTPLEKTNAVRYVWREYGDVKLCAEALHMSQQWVEKWVGIILLPEDVQDMVTNKEISADYALHCWNTIKDYIGRTPKSEEEINEVRKLIENNKNKNKATRENIRKKLKGKATDEGIEEMSEQISQISDIATNTVQVGFSQDQLDSIDQITNKPEDQSAREEFVHDAAIENIGQYKEYNDDEDEEDE